MSCLSVTFRRLFISSKKQKWSDFEGESRWEGELEIVEEGETIEKGICMRKESIFNLKKKKEKLRIKEMKRTGEGVLSEAEH